MTNKSEGPARGSLALANRAQGSLAQGHALSRAELSVWQSESGRPGLADWRGRVWLF